MEKREAFSLYDSFSVKDVKNTGGAYKVKCIANRGYEGLLTIGKEYQITVTEPIMPMSPLCIVVADNGRKATCHIHRFEKIEEIQNRSAS